MKNLFITCILFIFSVSALFSEDLKIKNVDSSNEAPAFAGFVDNEIVIKLDRSFAEKVTRAVDALETGSFGIAAFDELGSRLGVDKIWQKFPRLKVRELNGRTIDPSSWFSIKFKTNTDVELAVRAYKLLAGVVDAQPIGIHKVYAMTPNDPNYADQWHLNQSNDADIDAPEAWDVQTGNSDIIVAILDTGVRYYHKDLGGANASSSNPGASQGNMWINTAEKNGSSGVDDDNNGFTDDWIGWDFVDGVTGWTGEDVSTPDNDPRDFNGHGTHCAGIVGAINNNNYAVSSPAGGWANGSQQVQGNGVKIMPLRIGYSGRYLFFLEVGYVRMDFAASAFYYAADNGAKIASCSWGSSNTGGLGDAIDYFVSGGGLVFKAAGNDDDQTSDYMLDRADVIGVASTDENDVKSDFSTYGTFVDISAPGSNIYSTYHDHTDAGNDYVASLSGTSMATPLTASVASLIWSQNPTWSSDQVRQQLYDTADDIYGLSGNASYAGKLGAGRINAYKAVSTGSGPAAPVAGFSGTPITGCGPLAVQFTDESTGNVTDWSWDFGDGGSSGLQNPDHQYADPGKYTVALTVTGDGGTDSETKTDYITVYAPITADFSGTPVSGDAPLTIDFT
ncbi:MAG: S8 family serine peptidase, partial [Calditrichaceae bacterium]